MNKFNITYEDGTNFQGDPFKSEWNNIDQSKKIIKFEYVVGQLYLALEGYKQYNHLLEYTALGQQGLVKIFLMGRKEEITDIIVIDVKQNKIYKDEKPIYCEYGKQILSGWQEGILKEPKSCFKRLQNHVQ